MSSSVERVTESPEATEALGVALAALLPAGSVVALRGNLAAGKTCLVRGIARAHGVEENISSPTFTLVNEYPSNPTLYHLDLYRIGSAEEGIDLGCEELFSGDGICLVEWAERAEELLPATRVEIALEHGGGDTRRIAIEDRGVLPERWADKL